jgi:hypothetical protein
LTTTDVTEAPPEVVEADENEAARKRLLEQKEELEKIVPNKEHRKWKLGDTTYTQKPLSYFAKMEWFSLLASTIDQAMIGENALTVSGMLNQVGVTREGKLTLADFKDADVFINGVAKLLIHSPEFLQDCFCIWLAVPHGDRLWAKNMMSRPSDEGGFSDDQGFEIIEAFLDQNADALESFFVERIPKLARRARKMVKYRPTKSH